MKTVFPENQVNYVLRMYLPRWNYEKIIADIIKFCKETGTEHVMLFTDAQHMVWNQLTIEEAREEAENISRAIADLGKHGIKVGINSSYNMLMSRFDHTEHNPQYKHWATLADGTCDKRTPCLLDPALKVYLDEFYRILAATNAEYIYIDDDHRYIFAGRNNTWGCMCDLHLAEFSKLTGKEWTRPELQKAILNDKTVQKQWIMFLKKPLEELAAVISNAVHSVNPEMTVGVMVPCLHCTTLYDYDLPKMARIFQPEGKLLLRPCIGPYSDRDRQQIVPGLFYMETIDTSWAILPNTRRKSKPLPLPASQRVWKSSVSTSPRGSSTGCSTRRSLLADMWETARSLNRKSPKCSNGKSPTLKHCGKSLRNAAPKRESA